MTRPGADGKPVTALEPVKDGSDIQSIFFDMWRQEHPEADLKDVPGDLVTASASGLDPHISLDNAEFQLDRVAAKWAADLKRDPGARCARRSSRSCSSTPRRPWTAWPGSSSSTCWKLNLALRQRYGSPS